MNNPVKLLHKKISKLSRIYWVGKKIFFIRTEYLEALPRGQ